MPREPKAGDSLIEVSLLPVLTNLAAHLAQKKFKVLAKKGDQIKLIRYGDPNMTIKKSNPGRRKNFRARHSCDTAKDNFTARYWSCKNW